PRILQTRPANQQTLADSQSSRGIQIRSLPACCPFESFPSARPHPSAPAAYRSLARPTCIPTCSAAIDAKTSIPPPPSCTSRLQSKSVRCCLRAAHRHLPVTTSPRCARATDNTLPSTSRPFSSVRSPLYALANFAHSASPHSSS